MVESSSRRKRGSPFVESLAIAGDCIVWTAAKTGGGYGNYMHPITKLNIRAHVYAWESFNGPVLEGYELHHICHTRLCVKVDHLQMVTRAKHREIEGLEITHCPSGHEYNEENTYVRTNGRRQCRVCHRERMRVVRKNA